MVSIAEEGSLPVIDGLAYAGTGGSGSSLARVLQIRCRTEMDDFANRWILWDWYRSEIRTVMVAAGTANGYHETIETHSRPGQSKEYLVVGAGHQV